MNKRTRFTGMLDKHGSRIHEGDKVLIKRADNMFGKEPIEIETVIGKPVYIDLEDTDPQFPLIDVEII